MLKIFLSILLAAGLVWGALLQASFLDTYRGQAMAMPFIKTIAETLILTVIYTIAFFIDKKLKQLIWKYAAILIQVGVVIYSIKMYVYYCNFKQGNIPIDEWDSDYFPPGNFNFVIIGFISFALLYYSFKKIATRK